MKDILGKKEVMNNWTFLAISSWAILWASAIFFNVFGWNLAMPANVIMLVYGCVFGALLLYKWFEKK